jgi:hypothetical protein
MATGKYSDVKIYEAEFYGGMNESVAQNVNVFNAASNGAIRLISIPQKGHYEKTSFWKDISGLVSRRDITSVAGVTDLAMAQDETVAVKLNRKIGPVGQTLDTWRKLGLNSSEMSFQFGKLVGDRVTKEWVNLALSAASAAIGAVGALVHTISANGTITHGEMVKGSAKMGDAAGRVRAYVMHSKPFFDLLGQSLTDKIVNVADMVIFQGNVATFGRPVIVTDAPGLLVTGTPDLYHTLALTEDAIVVNESEQREILSDIALGTENIIMRAQGEYAYSIKIKGTKWDIANGGLNPLDAAIATGSNWDKVVTDNKDMAGFKIVSG